MYPFELNLVSSEVSQAPPPPTGLAPGVRVRTPGKGGKGKKGKGKGKKGCALRADTYNSQQIPANCRSDNFPVGKKFCVAGITYTVEKSWNSVGGSTVNHEKKPGRGTIPKGTKITFGSCEGFSDSPAEEPQTDGTDPEPEKKYNCRTRELWSADKKKWCCDNEGICKTVEQPLVAKPTLPPPEKTIDDFETGGPDPEPELNCDDPPRSMNGGKFQKGCAGAVWMNGKPAKRYCLGDGDRFPWWKKCCRWSNSEGVCKTVSLTSQDLQGHSHSYQFLFNGCPKGTMVSYAKRRRGKYSKKECADLCDSDRNCNVMEVNGCKANSNCRGDCWLFSGSGTGIGNGNAGTTCNEAMSGDKDVDYRGCQAITSSGRKCQKWTSQNPHKHSRTPKNYPGKGLGDHNYCRNPDGEPTIWCYTTRRRKRWETCRNCVTNGDQKAYKKIRPDDPDDYYGNRQDAGGTSCPRNKYHTKYTPIDNIPGQRRTVTSKQGCADRCQRVPACKYWSRWPDGGCHLSASSSRRVYSRRVTSGEKCDRTNGRPMVDEGGLLSTQQTTRFEAQPLQDLTLAGDR